MPFTREEIVNSREYKIAGAALNDVSNIDEEYADNKDYIGGYVEGFESGAEWSDENPNEGLVSIDKVCEWLRTNHDEIYLRYVRGYNADDEIEIFKKAMEEQQ